MPPCYKLGYKPHQYKPVKKNQCQNRNHQPILGHCCLRPQSWVPQPLGWGAQDFGLRQQNPRIRRWFLKQAFCRVGKDWGYEAGQWSAAEQSLDLILLYRVTEHPCCKEISSHLTCGDVKISVNCV